ncbi:MAG: type II toxin-antitoxin system VapC family toxin [Phycisphaerae bacterium]|nr:type II toxin-antitoxin system VapC family toxin [Phycisphaerae bacterium]
MIFDTDVLIWVLRGNARAAKAVDASAARSISVVTYMELLQGARNKREIKAIKGFLTDLRFQTLPLTENVGHRASIYMEEYGLTVDMSMPDALIAATAVENHELLLTGNQKHYKSVNELELRVCKP